MILIIDSEKVADINIKFPFHDLGLESIEVVKTVDAAISFIKNHSKISMIIINGELEGGDGYKLCQQIRKQDVGRTAYIFIVVSSVKNKTAIEKAKHCGANDFLVKPFNGAIFKEKIAKYISSRVVVLVEDDPVIQMTVKTVLSKYPIEVISIDDGVKAHNLFKSMLPVRLVLLDIGLPNMSGLQLIKAIRNNDKWKKSAVVMLTGSMEANDVKTSLASGANGYITKPFKVEEFVSKLEKYLTDGS